MKVLRVIPSMDPKKGGPSEGIRQIQKEIYNQRIDVECDIVTLDPVESDFEVNKHLNVISLGNGKTSYSFSTKLKKWLQQNIVKYDLVIIHGIWQYHSHIASLECRKKKVPYYVYTHGMLDPWFRKKYPLKHLKKLGYWLLVEKNVINNSQAVIFTCEEERILARQSFPFYHPEEHVTTYGTAGCKFEQSHTRQLFYDRYPALKGKKIILFMGRIHEKKGCDILLESFSNILSEQDDFHLFFAGPDDSHYARKMKDECNRLNLSKYVTWGGMLQGEIKWGAYNASYLFCLPSHQENFGIVVAEALSCSLPVIISNKVNIWREIETEKAGLVSNDTVESFSKKLSEFVTLKEQVIYDYKTNALNCYEKHFDISNVASTFYKIIARKE
jgi:glycosyltransferase involved in cell wall biosynthesis